MTKRASTRMLIQKRVRISLGDSISLASQLHLVDDSDKLLTGVRNRDIMMLAFFPLFG